MRTFDLSTAVDSLLRARIASFFGLTRSSEGISRRLEKLEESASRATNGYETQHLLRAGELCATSGDRERALRYYGRALDRYLMTGRLTAAEVLCRRMTTVAPRAVRVRGTQMWLVAARGSRSEIRVAVNEYVRAGIAVGQEKLVALQLNLLAAASSPEVREIAAKALLDLGASEESEHWLTMVYDQSREGVQPVHSLADPEWEERMLEAVLLAPQEARRLVSRKAA